jgi:hypothetical protein
LKTTLKTITTPIGRGHTSYSRDLSIESKRKEKKSKKKQTYIKNIKEREQTLFTLKIHPHWFLIYTCIYISGYRIRKKKEKRYLLYIED